MIVYDTIFQKCIAELSKSKTIECSRRHASHDVIFCHVFAVADFTKRCSSRCASVTSRLGGGRLHEAVLEPVRQRELVDASQRLDELVDAGVAAEDAPLLEREEGELATGLLASHAVQLDRLDVLDPLVLAARRVELEVKVERLPVAPDVD